MKIVPPYPIPAYAFNVLFKPALGKEKFGFVEVHGLDIITKKDSQPEQNELGHLPFFELNRGLMPADAFTSWYIDVLEFGKARRHTITVELLDHQEKKVASWEIVNALPVRWYLNSLNAMENRLANETVQFSYEKIRRLV